MEKFGAKTVSWICDPLLTGEGGGLPRGGPPPGGRGWGGTPGGGHGCRWGGVSVGGKGVYACVCDCHTASQRIDGRKKNQFRATLRAFTFGDDKLPHSANKIAHNQSMCVFGHKESHRPAWVVACPIGCYRWRLLAHHPAIVIVGYHDATAKVAQSVAVALREEQDV